MQLLSITLYNIEGDTREIKFELGQLNIVTGESKTGKSTLLYIVDYCLGNDSVSIPRSEPMNAVEWYGTLWQFDDGSRVFIGRRRRHQGAANAAMLKFGGKKLSPPRFEDLNVNATSDIVRSQVGSRLGLMDAKLQPSESSSRAFKVSLGSAALLCFQEQDEIASKHQLFHRQREAGVSEHIKDTLPYFLGAVGGDQASKRQELRDARRALRRLDSDLQSAVDDSSELDITLNALIMEAHVAGLTAAESAPSRAVAIEILDAARGRVVATLPDEADVEAQDARRQLEEERDALRQQLHDFLAEREVVLERRAGMDSYGNAIAVQTARLVSLDLLHLEEGSQEVDDVHCPVCHSKLHDTDPTVDQLNGRLTDLRNELSDLAAANPVTAEALEALTEKAGNARQRLSAIDSALRALSPASDRASDTERRDFIRGRIDATLERTERVDDREILRMRQRREVLLVQIAALEDELNAEAVEQAVAAKLHLLSLDMTEWGTEIDLEHASDGVRLDLNRLTVVADTRPIPTPMAEIGSAANSVGYHLVAHLALHKLFTNYNRPVPRLLMLDQPTQPFQSRGGDKKAIKSIFQISQRVADELAPNMQIIIIDHANIKKPWFQRSVVHDWETEALVPREWYE